MLGCPPPPPPPPPPPEGDAQIVVQHETADRIRCCVEQDTRLEPIGTELVTEVQATALNR